MNLGSAIPKSPLLCLLALVLTDTGLRAQGLGDVSSCAEAPQIAAAATSFALQNDSGLNARQASAVVTTVVRQATQAAPYAVAAITTAAMESIQQTVLQTAAQGKTPQGDLSHEQVALLTPQEAVTVADGYRKMTKAIAQGAIDGAVSSGMGAPELQQLIAAVTTSMVKDAGVQAALTAATTKNGTPDPTKGLPMDTAEEGKTVTAMLVATLVQVAQNSGFTEKEISTAVNRAAAECTATAQNIGAVIQQEFANGASRQVAGQVANQVASQVAAEVAKQVATAVAAEVLYHTVPKSPERNTDTPEDTPPPINQPNQNTPTTSTGDNTPPLPPRILPTPVPASPF